MKLLFPQPGGPCSRYPRRYGIPTGGELNVQTNLEVLEPAVHSMGTNSYSVSMMTFNLMIACMGDDATML